MQSGLRFLHDDARLAHNSLRLGVFVTPAGDWKMNELGRVAPFE